MKKISSLNSVSQGGIYRKTTFKCRHRMPLNIAYFFQVLGDSFDCSTTKHQVWHSWIRRESDGSWMSCSRLARQLLFRTSHATSLSRLSWRLRMSAARPGRTWGSTRWTTDRRSCWCYYWESRSKRSLPMTQGNGRYCWLCKKCRCMNVQEVSDSDHFPI